MDKQASCLRGVLYNYVHVYLSLNHINSDCVHIMVACVLNTEVVVCALVFTA